MEFRAAAVPTIRGDNMLDKNAQSLLDIDGADLVRSIKIDLQPRQLVRLIGDPPGFGISIHD